MENIIKYENQNYFMDPKQIIQNQLELDISLLVDEFIHTKTSRHTQTSYRLTLMTFFEIQKIYYFGDLVDRMINFKLNKQITDYLNDYKNNDNWKIRNPRTINQKLATFSSFFRFLNEKYNIQYNPVKSLKPMKSPRHSNHNSLNEIELKALLSFVKNKYEKKQNIGNLRNYLIFSFLSLSLRRSEVSGLRFDDINYNLKTIRIIQKNNTEKVLPIPANLFNLLINYKLLKEKEGNQSVYLFNPIYNRRTWDVNKPISTDYIYSLVIKTWLDLHFWEELESTKKEIEKLRNRQRYYIRKKDQLKIDEIRKQIQNLRNFMKEKQKELRSLNKHISCHSFRKTAIEIALDKGIDMISIKNMTWHSDIKMIDYYQTLDSIKNNAINELDLF